MTAKKITISVPEDVAAQLAGVGNVSAYVTEALRRDRGRESMRDLMARHGVVVTDEGVAGARRLLEERRAARAARRRADEEGPAAS
jgi:hypothetical protein